MLLLLVVLVVVVLVLVVVVVVLVVIAVVGVHLGHLSEMPYKASRPLKNRTGMCSSCYFSSSSCGSIVYYLGFIENLIFIPTVQNL